MLPLSNLHPLALEIALTPPPDTEQTRAMTSELQQQLYTLGEEAASLEAKLGRRRQANAPASARLRDASVATSLRSQQQLLAWGGPPPSLVPYELRVHVYQALGLPPLDGNGSANPLVRILSPHWAVAGSRR